MSDDRCPACDRPAPQTIPGLPLDRGDRRAAKAAGVPWATETSGLCCYCGELIPSPARRHGETLHRDCVRLVEREWREAVEAAEAAGTCTARLTTRACRGGRVDWRARALAAEAEVARLLGGAQ